MIYTEEVFEIEDCVLALCQEIISSTQAAEHLHNRFSIETDSETKVKERAFVEAREAYERVEAYGKYAPDYTEKRRKLRQEKRQLDMDQHVSAFRVSERELQEVLDRVTYGIAQSVSKDIKIDAGNPFFEFADRGCGGSCSVG